MMQCHFPHLPELTVVSIRRIWHLPGAPGVAARSMGRIPSRALDEITLCCSNLNKVNITRGYRQDLGVNWQGLRMKS